MIRLLSAKMYLGIKTDGANKFGWDWDAYWLGRLSFSIYPINYKYIKTKPSSYIGDDF